ncbi:hypothetical protein COLO4_08513 [Corchorus olitorius]|uniref:Reverse transcriptase zinc-binding domain-containing protein n=1 Tax=Corchorus olitorius TaxID=93759 RepID=A0A1R3KFI8_9ROSI|nr:hypothetical protein COLO4_08513 [Corchorus olitorius]
MGWRLMEENDKLWARVMTSKYLRKGEFLKVENKNGGSFGWRSILAGRETLSKGLKWRVGNDNQINFLHDKWVSDNRLIDNVVGQTDERLLQAKVSQFYDEYGWKTEELLDLLPADIVRKIQAIPIQISHHVQDKMIWGSSPNGEFSTKSAYQIQAACDDIESPIAKAIWKIPCQPKMQTFLWLAWKNRIMHNRNRVLGEFGNGGMKGVLLIRAILFLIGWEKPKEGQVKINTDGSWTQRTNEAAVGGVVRGSCVEWLLGFSQSVGKCSIDLVELWGILQGVLNSLIADAVGVAFPRMVDMGAWAFLLGSLVKSSWRICWVWAKWMDAWALNLGA